MLELFDPQAMRLHADAHRARLVGTMRAGWRPPLTHRLGAWLVAVGERLSQDDPPLRPATDCR